MPEQRIGILGATSLVGRNLLQQLASDHKEITAFSRQPVSTNQTNVTWYQITSDQVNTEQAQIPLWICAAPIWVLPEYYDWLLSYDIRRIVVLSSTSRFTKKISSDSTELATAQRLINSENSLEAWATAHQIEWIILRPTLIYGYGEDKNISEIARFIIRFGFFPLLGAANGLRQPIHAEDVSTACINALYASYVINQAYNITGNETLSYRDMVKRIFIALNQKPRLITIPRYFFQLAVQWLHHIPRYHHWTTAMADRMNQDLIFDCSNAARDLNFSSRPFTLAQSDLPTIN